MRSWRESWRRFPATTSPSPVSPWRTSTRRACCWTGLGTFSTPATTPPAFLSTRSGISFTRGQKLKCYIHPIGPPSSCAKRQLPRVPNRLVRAGPPGLRGLLPVRRRLHGPRRRHRDAAGQDGAARQSEHPDVTSSTAFFTFSFFRLRVSFFFAARLVFLVTSPSLTAVT
jgi:hypothetical protein